MNYVFRFNNSQFCVFDEGTTLHSGRYIL